MILFNKSSTSEKNVITAPSISRNSLVWLFLVQVFILAPHFLSIPLWIAVVWSCVIFWRWKIFQGAWSYPDKLQKTLVVLMCGTGLVVSLGVSFSLMSMVSLLVVGFVLKLLEMKNRKDFVLLVYIAFFILATQFILFNHFVAAIYGFFVWLCCVPCCCSFT